MNLTIDNLSLEFEAPESQRHRVEPITRRALTLLAQLVATRLPTLSRSAIVGGADLQAGSLEIDLALMGDEEVAERIAGTLYAGISAHLAVGSGR